MAGARGLESATGLSVTKDKKKCLSDTTDISYIRGNACGSRLSRISCVSACCDGRLFQREDFRKCLGLRRHIPRSGGEIERWSSGGTRGPLYGYLHSSIS